MIGLDRSTARVIASRASRPSGRASHETNAEALDPVGRAVPGRGATPRLRPPRRTAAPPASPRTAPTTPRRCSRPSSGAPAARRRCVVALCDGLFRIAPVRVGDFRGTLRGAGQRAHDPPGAARSPGERQPRAATGTDDPLEPSPAPVALPAAAHRGPRNGAGPRRSRSPRPAEDRAPTRGWTELPGVRNEELAGAILVTGREAARSEVTRVRITAGEYETGFGPSPTLLAGVALRGLVYDPDAVDPGDPVRFPRPSAGGAPHGLGQPARRHGEPGCPSASSGGRRA